MAITVSCGFQSAAHFSTCYKDLFGHPPSAERRLAARTGAVPQRRS
jgi:transcriptional regulator GlxA family with amidase domain